MAIARSARDMNGPGLSGYVQSWLSSWGFVGNPFGRWEASEEPWLERYFVRPPFFDQLLESPRSTLVFAQRGGGKSATRIMIQAEYRPNAPASAVLAVPFTDWGPFLEPYGRVPDLTLKDYVPHLIRCALPGLLASVLRSASSEQDLSDAELGVLRFWFQHYSPLSHEGHQLATAMVFFDPQMDARQRTLFSTRILSQAPLPAGAPEWLTRLAQVWAQLHAVSAVPPPGRTDLPSRLMQTFVESALTLLSSGRIPCHTFCLLVDGVDEFAETQDDPESTARLLSPLIGNLRFLEIPGFVAKFFLPAEQRTALERVARIDRLETLTLTWEEPQPQAAGVLRTLLQRRIAAYNARGMRSLGELCAAPLRRTIEDELLEEAGSSPRNLMRLGNLLIAEHCRQPPEANSVITLEEWAFAQARFRAGGFSTARTVDGRPPAPRPHLRPDADAPGDPVPRLRIDLASGEIWIGQARCEAPSALVYELLHYLYLKRGQICTKAEIAVAVYDSSAGQTADELTETYGDAIDQLVRRLRLHIEPQPSQPVYVQTIKRRGYRLDHAG